MINKNKGRVYLRGNNFNLLCENFQLNRNVHNRAKEVMSSSLLVPTGREKIEGKIVLLSRLSVKMDFPSVFPPQYIPPSLYDYLSGT